MTKLNGTRMDISKIDLVSGIFKIAVGERLDRGACVCYVKQQGTTLLIEGPEENNDYNCPEDRSILLIKTDENEIVRAITLTL
jgi:hypothetical protein